MAQSGLDRFTVIATGNPISAGSSRINIDFFIFGLFYVLTYALIVAHSLPPIHHMA